MIHSILEIILNTKQFFEKENTPGTSIEIKEDGSPVTSTDKIVDAYISSELRKLNSKIPILTEENTVIPYDQRKDLKQFWLIDPLDGTKEFIKGLDEFTVNIALIENNQPTLGAVFAPLKNLLYYATQSGGSWKQEGTQPAKRIFSNSLSLEDEFTVLESRSHPSAELEDFLKKIKIKKRIQMGSSLKICLVADGTADLYPRLGPTMEWDVAAADCVYRYSGKDKPRYSSLTYNKKNLKNESFIIGMEKKCIEKLI